VAIIEFVHKYMADFVYVYNVIKLIYQIDIEGNESRSQTKRPKLPKLYIYYCLSVNKLYPLRPTRTIFSSKLNAELAFVTVDVGRVIHERLKLVMLK
jgi:hypothetical protein